MEQNHAGDGSISIGEDDQVRDQRMLREKIEKEGVDGGYGDEPTQTPEEQRRDQHEHDAAHVRPTRPVRLTAKRNRTLGRPIDLIEKNPKV